MDQEMIRKAALKVGLASTNATLVPMHKLEAFAQEIQAEVCEMLALKLLNQPLNDTAHSIAIWIREQK